MKYFIVIYILSAVVSSWSNVAAPQYYDECAVDTFCEQSYFSFDEYDWIAADA